MPTTGDWNSRTPARSPAAPVPSSTPPSRAPAGADALIVMHRLASIAVVVLALAAAWTVRADRARAATIVVVALGALAMGVVATLRQPSLVGTVAHNAFAALLGGALAGAAAARQR